MAQRCLYGVDRNPMAVDLARLSLWLATLARDHEFSFLDHALKSGDSLVGLTAAEIKAAHWDAGKPGLPLFRKMIEDAVGRALEGREAIRNAPDNVSLAMQSAKHRRVEDEVEPARLVGDAVIAAFFSADKPKEREKARTEVESWITSAFDTEWGRVRAKAQAFRAAQGWRPFHWEIEFPEVFARENPGFDAVVGNPPFLGGSSISTELGPRYLRYLLDLLPTAGDKTDLVLYFFARSWQILRLTGIAGLVATKTIAQGDSRSSLKILKDEGFHLFRATKRLVWPATANVIVSVLHLSKQIDLSPKFINNRRVKYISVYLKDNNMDLDPERIEANEGRIYEGFGPYGDGFLLEIGSDIEKNLIDSGESAILFSYIGGEDIMDSPCGLSTRLAIYTGKIDELELKITYPNAYRHIEKTVKRERLKKSKRVASMPWWQFLWPRPELRLKMALLEHIIARPRVAKHHAFMRLDSKSIISNSSNVICSSRYSSFAVLQSRLHEMWSRTFSSSMKDDLRYAPSDCFETFPFPTGYETDPVLEAAGQTYHDHRAELMVAANEGMTKTYNRFHNAEDRVASIQKLRELHDRMDQAVLRAYGWGDLADSLEPVFLTPETEDDHTYQTRYFWPAEGRDQVLARLLALNAQQHAEEVAAGIAPKRRSNAKGAEADADTADLLDG